MTDDRCIWRYPAGDRRQLVCQHGHSPILVFADEAGRMPLLRQLAREGRLVGAALLEAEQLEVSA
ncbi:MAG: hypothetical protein QOG85_217 [Gaiellaceae bacterium]|jgi:hypothetical protein|nr:hypothetical protein [Gaiellaceae bacterium]